MDLLRVYKYIQDEAFLNRVEQPLRKIINHKMQTCFVAVSSINLDQPVVSKQSVFLTKSFSPIVIDRGISYFLTHNKSDYISKLSHTPISTLQPLNNNIKVQGIGRVQ